MKVYLSFLLLFLFLSVSVVKAAEVPMQTTDMVYEPQIRTVLLYPASDDAVSATLQAPVLPIDQASPLILEFDELGDKINYYRAKFFFCNADWTVSSLSDMDFVARFNEFTFEQPKLSGNNARVHYTHQRLEVPQVKLPGNYLLLVFREGNAKDIVVTRRFVVYDRIATIAPKITFPPGVTERRTNQQVEFTVDYGNLTVANPWTSLRVVIRQNYLWQTAITDLKPTSVREDLHLAEYRPFNLESNFPGGNEFRFFDIRSSRSLGQNVVRLDPRADTTQAYLAPSTSRGTQPYGQVIDQNGRFVIDQYEFSNGDVEADYVRVHFALKADPIKEPIYIWGALTDWRVSKNNQMVYDTETGMYRGGLLLKQGYYNYRYVIGRANNTSLDQTTLEGSHFETENVYEIIVYNRPPGARADRIVGYVSIPYNKR